MEEEEQEQQLEFAACGHEQHEWSLWISQYGALALSRGKPYDAYDAHLEIGLGASSNFYGACGGNCLFWDGNYDGAEWLKDELLKPVQALQSISHADLARSVLITVTMLLSPCQKQAIP